jgi:hypothetical protein
VKTARVARESKWLLPPSRQTLPILPCQEGYAKTRPQMPMLMFFSRHAPARRVASGLGISSSRVPVEFKACFGLLTGLGISSSRVPVEFKACFGLLNVQSFAEFEEAS